MSGQRWRAHAALLGLLLAACAGPEDQRKRVDVASREHFELVSEMLGARCGSLDCHGQVGRNLRLYSRSGLRLDPAAVPEADAGVGTDAETEANYRSVIALEPELLRLVIEDGGEQPERLTLIRKARGTESHKGGQALVPTSSGDNCLVSWLQGNLNGLACLEGARLSRPNPGGL